MCTQMPVVLDTKAKLLLWLCSNVGHSLPFEVQFYVFSSHKRGKLCLKLGLVQAIPIILFLSDNSGAGSGSQPSPGGDRRVWWGHWSCGGCYCWEWVWCLFHITTKVLYSTDIFLLLALCLLSLCMSEDVITCVEEHETMWNYRLRM